MMTKAPAVVPERSLKWRCFGLKSQSAMRPERERLAELGAVSGTATFAIIPIKQILCHRGDARTVRPQSTHPQPLVTHSNEKKPLGWCAKSTTDRTGSFED